LCEYSVAFSDTIHLFERRGDRLIPLVVGKFVHTPEDRSLPDFSVDFSISQFCLFINSMRWCLFFLGYRLIAIPLFEKYIFSSFFKWWSPFPEFTMEL
jgi:hypothetical protein